MEDYSDNHSPWTNDSRVKSVVIQNGITAIGSDAFRYCEKLKNITILADSSDLSRLQQSLAGWSAVLGQK